MLKRRRRVTLCQHIKGDGAICRSPALRKRRYCHAHVEQRRRELRMARRRTAAQLRAEALETQRILGPMCEALMNSPGMKNLMRNHFDENTLRDTFGLNPDDSGL